MISKSQKERAQKVFPGGTRKKGELRKVSKWHQKVRKKKYLGFSHFFPKNGPGTFLGTFLGTFPGTFPGRILCKIGTFSGFAAIFLTANALYSPVRKENPASRACGKNWFSFTTQLDILVTTSWIVGHEPSWTEPFWTVNRVISNRRFVNRGLPVRSEIPNAGISQNQVENTAMTTPIIANPAWLKLIRL